MERAVDGLRQAGHQEFIVRGLLARAEYYRVTGDLNKAQKDLDEAFSIASRGGMGLHLADCHLEYARLSLRARSAKQSPDWMMSPDGKEIASGGVSIRLSDYSTFALAMTEMAREHWGIAKESIEEMGYHRRDREMEELEEALSS